MIPSPNPRIPRPDESKRCLPIRDHAHDCVLVVVVVVVGFLRVVDEGLEVASVAGDEDGEAGGFGFW